MAFEDIGEYIEKLRDEGVLFEVNAEVNWDLEIGGVVDRLNKTYPADLPPVLFNSIRGYPNWRFFVNGFAGPTAQSIAMGLPRTTGIRKLIDVFRERVKHPIKPKTTRKDAEFKEIKLTGDDVNLLEIPAPKWHYMDGGRYLGTWHAVITKDPENGWMNLGMYRIMLHDRKTLGIMINPRNHGMIHLRKYIEAGEPMPVAISIGHDELISAACAEAFPYGQSEYDIAGALRQEAVKIVDCETSDLKVPLSSQLVIEGEVSFDDLKPEGPFGEWTGYYGGETALRPVIKVKCITYREDPIFRGSYLSTPPCENHTLWALTKSAMIKHHLDTVGMPGIRDVYVHPSTGATLIAVSIEQSYPQHGREVGEAILASKYAQFSKMVIVTNEDINVTDLGEILWAVHWRSQPEEWVVLRKKPGSVLDPSVPVEWRGFTSKILIDATWPWNPDFPPVNQWNNRRYPPTIQVDEKTRKTVDEKWSSYGLGGNRFSDVFRNVW